MLPARLGRLRRIVLIVLLAGSLSVPIAVGFPTEAPGRAPIGSVMGPEALGPAVGSSGSIPISAAPACPAPGTILPPACRLGLVATPDGNGDRGNSTPVPEVGTLIATVPTGAGPAQAMYDPVTGYTYVADQRGNSVMVLNGPQVVATIRAGTGPFSMDFDPAGGEAFVGNTGSNNVSVFTGATETATITTAFDTSAVAFDPRHGYLYAASNTAGSVEVIENHTVLGAVQVGSLPKALAFDNATGEVYVANEGSANVSVLDGGRLAATVAVGSFPESLAFDPVNGFVYVANYVDATVSVLNGSAVVATVPVGADPIAVLIDPRSGDAYVCGSGNRSVAVLSGTRVTQWLTVGAGPTGGVYDPANGDMYVTSLNGASLTALRGASVLGTIGLRPGPEGAAFDAHRGDLIVPDFSDDNLSVISTLLAESAVGQSPPGDPMGSSDVGQSVTLGAVAWAIGTGNDTVTSAVVPASGLGCGSPVRLVRLAGQVDLNLSCVPSDPGNYTVWINVSDSDGARAWAFERTEVFADPTVGVVGATLGAITNATSADVTQTFGLSATASGGTGRYVLFAWSGLPPGACRGLSTSSASCVLDQPTNLSVSLEVTDSNHATARSLPLAFRILSLPTAGSPVPSRLSIDVGQTLALSTDPSGGAGNYTFDWSGLPEGCAENHAARPSCVAVRPGPIHAACTVTDSNGGHSTTVLAPPVVVLPDPVLAPPNLDPGRILLGAEVVMTANASGGSGGYAYSWTGLPPGCAADGPSVACRPNESGTFVIRAIVNDSNGVRVVSNGSTLFVERPPPATIPGGLTVELGIGAVVAAAGAIVLVFARRRRALSLPPPTPPR